MKNVILVAPPAAGKGTQSELLVKEYGYIHISMGDLLREVIASGSEVGKQIKSIIDEGKLVDDDLTIDLIRDKLKAIKGHHYCLDGFPRTIYQAHEFDKVMDELGNEDYVVLYLDLSENKAYERIAGRLICSCGKSYNIFNEELKPKVEGICDNCGKELVKRTDDNAESFKTRYQVVLENFEPIKEFYANKGKLKIIDVDRNVDEIFSDIVKGITND